MKRYNVTYRRKRDNKVVSKTLQPIEANSYHDAMLRARPKYSDVERFNFANSGHTANMVVYEVKLVNERYLYLVEVTLT